MRHTTTSLHQNAPPVFQYRPFTQTHPPSPSTYTSAPREPSNSVQPYSLLPKPISQHRNVLTSCFFRHQDAHCVHGECYTMLQCWRVILNDRRCFWGFAVAGTYDTAFVNNCQQPARTCKTLRTESLEKKDGLGVERTSYCTKHILIIASSSPVEGGVGFATSRWYGRINQPSKNLNWRQH